MTKPKDDLTIKIEDWNILCKRLRDNDIHKDCLDKQKVKDFLDWFEKHLQDDTWNKLGYYKKKKGLLK